MSSIQINGITPTRNTLIAILGTDTVDLTPVDARYSYSYAVTSAPGGSSATFSGARFTPDVAGAYVLTVSCNNDSLAVNVFAFASSVYNGLTPRVPTPAYSDAEKRSILGALANGYLTSTSLTAWNNGTMPAGLNLLQFGGR